VATHGHTGAVERCFRADWRTLFFQKLCDWSTEREFRILTLTPDATDNPLRVSYGDALRAVFTRNLSVAEEDQLARAVAGCFEGLAVHALDWVNNHPATREIWPDR